MYDHFSSIAVSSRPTPAAAFSATAFADTHATAPEWPVDDYLASIDPSPALLVEASASDSSENLEVSSRNQHCGYSFAADQLVYLRCYSSSAR